MAGRSGSEGGWFLRWVVPALGSSAALALLGKVLTNYYEVCELNNGVGGPKLTIVGFYLARGASLMNGPIGSCACFAAGAAIAFGGLWARRYLAPPAVGGSTSSTIFEITGPPRASTHAPGKIRIEGTWRGPEPQYDRMRVVTRRGNLYWPQPRRRLDIRPDGTWTCELEEHLRSTLSADVTATLARLDDQGILWAKLFEWAVEKHHEYPGIEFLPSPPRLDAAASIAFRLVPQGEA